MNARFTPSTAADEAAVRAVEAAYDSAWNAGDLASILQLFTDGVVITNPYGETTTGRDEAELFFTALLNGVGKGSRHSSQIRGVRFVTPDVGLVDADAAISDLGPGPEPVRHSSRPAAP